MYYDPCHQATIFRLLINDQVLRLMKIWDRDCARETIITRIKWLCNQPAIARGTGVIQIEVTPEVLQILNELQFLVRN